jgi:hypothetical protein
MSHLQFDCLSKGTSAIVALPEDPDEVTSPIVFFANTALATIRYLVQECNKEIAWLGLVDELTDGNYLITEILVPKQEVTGTSVDIDPEAMNTLAHELIVAGKDPGKLRYHGHSHVNMAVNPSQTDQEHMRDYLEHPDWFIRSIHNKKGDARVDVYDKRTMLVHHNVQHENWDLLQTQDFYDALDTVLKTQIAFPPPHAITPYNQRYQQNARRFQEQWGRQANNATSTADRKEREDAYYNSFKEHDLLDGLDDYGIIDDETLDRIALNRSFGLDDDDGYYMHRLDGRT